MNILPSPILIRVLDLPEKERDGFRQIVPLEEDISYGIYKGNVKERLVFKSERLMNLELQHYVFDVNMLYQVGVFDPDTQEPVLEIEQLTEDEKLYLQAICFTDKEYTGFRVPCQSKELNLEQEK